MRYIIIVLFIIFNQSKVISSEDSYAASVNQPASVKPFPYLDKIVDQYYLNTSQDLVKEAFRWYKFGNNAEVVAQIFGGITPICVSLSVAGKNYRLKTMFTISAGISSTLALSCNNFAKFSYNESKQRFKDLNRLLRTKGYEPLPLMDASLNSDPHIITYGIYKTFDTVKEIPKSDS